MPHHKSEKANINTQNSRKTKRTPKKITSTYLHNAGLYYLERFAASKSHFIEVMSRKAKRSCFHHTDQNYDDCIKIVLETADKFEQSGLLNDELYTRNMVESLRRKGLSRNALIQKMRIKGIDTQSTLKALELQDDIIHDSPRDAELNAALQFARKKRLGPYQPPMPEITDTAEQQKHLQRVLGKFARAGFSYEIAKEIIDMEDINE